MTICSGCGIVSDTTICCPICLKHNKKIFYCSQECYEKNYKDHKKFHYFIKIISNEEIYNKINEKNTTDVNGNLPVVILSNENESENNRNDKIKVFQNEKNSLDEKVLVNEYNSAPVKDHVETNIFNNKRYKNGKNGTFESKDRKKNYNKYKNITNDYLLNDKEESYSKNYLKKIPYKSKISYITNMISYLFSNKYNLILPYYNDMDLKHGKNDFKNSKIKNKLTDNQIIELKKKLRMKKILQLIILFILISVIVILSTFMFSFILESSHKKMQVNHKNLSNKQDTNKNSDITELKQYIKVIENLRKEINEIKEVLYMHNIYINKNFNLSNSYNIFNNFNKIKPSISSHHNKKITDKSSSLTSHLYYDNSYSNENYSKINNEDDNSTLKQYHYDVNDINELNSTDNKNINKDNYNPSIEISEETNSSDDNTEHTLSNHLENSFNTNEKKSDINKIQEENISNEEIDKHNNQNFLMENQLYNENNNNFIKNHKPSNEYEEATISNRIVNEEKIINSSSIGNNNKIKNEILDNKNIQNENLIYNHEMKEKHKKGSSKIEENEIDKSNRMNIIETDENLERKIMNSKLSKKKQKTI
ncbi:conserved Plasmodium protein, unknown function [Plasmodium relictum]|uniref:C6H2-type domain-containing protein n=1 Tax=Plasmodium relictum TaxID=85471 RepID=A0A1J1HCW7_PLARL|nr:conserved Plasmodium protein, unknown function [Plasmodium relictum]CRH03824.1 conserved Plasmodium protein, unknown function [Plasmodium relictum]